MKFRQKFVKFGIFRFLISVKLTTACLCLLYILTFWGTIAQIQDGLYQAQSKYFYSLYFLAMGFIPFPGAQLVMWVLFVNLVFVALLRFVYSWRNIGLIIIHSGLFLFLISGYVTFKGSQESYLNLKEGQATNVSTAYHDWEVSIWEQGPQENPLLISRDVTALDWNQLKTNQTIDLKDLKIQLTIKEHYNNCVAYQGKTSKDMLSATGIARLEPADLLKEPEKNNPGGKIHVRINNQDDYDVLLFAGETIPVNIQSGNKKYQMILRLKRFTLPFMLSLLDFKMERYPGTDTARSYQSLVEIQLEGAKREKLISMNIPLRYADMTFYQSSYSIDNRTGEESSVLAVVKNKGRVLPYIATFITILGLVVHFISMAFRSKKRKSHSQ